MFKKIKYKEVKPLLLGQPSHKIKADAIIESAYEKDGEERLEKQVTDLEKAAGKSLIHIFWYKHQSAMKFYGQLFRCLQTVISNARELKINNNFSSFLRALSLFTSC